MDRSSKERHGNLCEPGGRTSHMWIISAAVLLSLGTFACTSASSRDSTLADSASVSGSALEGATISPLAPPDLAGPWKLVFGSEPLVGTDSTCTSSTCREARLASSPVSTGATTSASSVALRSVGRLPPQPSQKRRERHLRRWRRRGRVAEPHA